jgi:hypothetical protein
MIHFFYNKTGKSYQYFLLILILIFFNILSHNLAANNKLSLMNKINACEFITIDEMEIILGEELNDPELIEQSEGSLTTASFAECVYTAKYSNKKISIFLRIYPVAEDTPTIIEETKFMLAETDPNFVELDTLGEDSYWSSGGLHVFTEGTTYFIVTISGFDDKSAFEKSIQAAELLIDRL